MNISEVRCSWWKCYGHTGGTYLVSLTISGVHGYEHAHPAARATVDDFGTLVIVRGWM